jgi:hypothetical protein
LESGEDEMIVAMLFAGVLAGMLGFGVALATGMSLGLALLAYAGCGSAVVMTLGAMRALFCASAPDRLAVVALTPRGARV